MPLWIYTRGYVLSPNAHLQTFNAQSLLFSEHTHTHTHTHTWHTLSHRQTYIHIQTSRQHTTMWAGSRLEPTDIQALRMKRETPAPIKHLFGRRTSTNFTLKWVAGLGINNKQLTLLIVAHNFWTFGFISSRALTSERISQFWWRANGECGICTTNNHVNRVVESGIKQQRHVRVSVCSSKMSELLMNVRLLVQEHCSIPAQNLRGRYKQRFKKKLKLKSNLTLMQIISTLLKTLSRSKYNGAI